MSFMNLQKINLNLLKALRALLFEQNVSKAGRRIGVTQSAMSIALKQLRSILRDDLLVRGPEGRMHLTNFAKKLIIPVNTALDHIDIVFSANMPFDPSTSERTFHIGMSDYIAFVLLPKMMKEINKLAPNIKIVQHAINYLDSFEPFEEFKLDFVIGDFAKVPGSLKTTHLFTDKGIIVADKNHPALQDKKLTLKKFLEYPQVFVSLESRPEENFIAEMLEKLGNKVKVNLITPHTLIALQTLPGTLLMTNTVEKLAQPFIKPLGLEVCDTPYKLPKYHAKLYWQARDQNEIGHRWFRELIKNITDEINV